MQTMTSLSDSRISRGQPPNDIQVQILRLQNFQQELQAQMQMLQSQKSENVSSQTNSVDNFIAQFHQRQDMSSNEQLSPSQQAPISSYLHQHSPDTDVSSPMAYRMPSSIGTSFSNMNYENASGNHPLRQQS